MRSKKQQLPGSSWYTFNNQVFFSDPSRVFRRSAVLGDRSWVTLPGRSFRYLWSNIRCTFPWMIGNDRFSNHPFLQKLTFSFLGRVDIPKKMPKPERTYIFQAILGPGFPDISLYYSPYHYQVTSVCSPLTTHDPGKCLDSWIDPLTKVGVSDPVRKWSYICHIPGWSVAQCHPCMVNHFRQYIWLISMSKAR